MSALEGLSDLLAPAKKRKEARKPETLEEAHHRISLLKWSEAERPKLDMVVEALQSGFLRRRDDTKKLSKKEVLELAVEYAILTRQAKLEELVRTKPDNYKIITDRTEFRRFITDLYDEPLTIWDTETTGLDLFADTIVGYSVWLPNAKYGVYVPFGHGSEITEINGRRVVTNRYEGQLPEDLCLNAIKEYLEDQTKKTAWHNAKFDLHMLANYGILAIRSFYFDTQVAANILNEEESHRLKDQAAKYLGVKTQHFDSLFGDDPTIWDKPFLPSGVYAINDVWYTFGLMNFQLQWIAPAGLDFVFWKVETPQVAASLEMERTGFALDRKLCADLENELQPAVDEALENVHRAFNTRTPEFLEAMCEKLGRKIDEFNIGSPDQLQYLIYDYLGMPDISKSVNPKLKPRSTAADVIEKLGEYNEDLMPLLDYREKEKLLNTYIRKFPNTVAPDGRIHYQLVQFGTDTGRYSSKQYGDKKNKKGVNIQNIPSRSKTAKKVKKALIADEGWLILTSDLGQIEPRTLADMSGDELLKLPYLTGDDLYIRMAMDLYEFDREYCIDGAYDPDGVFQPRKRSKTGLLAAMYGTSKWTLAQQMHISIEAAEEFLENFFDTYKDVSRFIAETKQFLFDNEYVVTKYGRKRRFHGFRAKMIARRKLERINWFNMTDEQKAELRELRKITNDILRAGVNARIQGTAADIIKLIIAEMHKLTKRKGWKFIATVHDEINIMVPETITREEVEEVNKVMTETVKLAVPIACDTTLGRSWGEDIPLDQWFEDVA